jgi:hypothetical protein
MTRDQFIQLAKEDTRVQLCQMVALMVVIAVFGSAASWMTARWEGQLFTPGTPYLWILCGWAILGIVAAVGAVRTGGKSLLRCPHCRKCLGGIPAQIVVASRRCGHCGEQIIDET